jgi:hypothetical protein
MPDLRGSRGSAGSNPATRENSFYLLGGLPGRALTWTDRETSRRTPQTPQKPKARIIGGNRTRCDKHQWEAPWPAAVVRQCINCKAWMVPPL